MRNDTLDKSTYQVFKILISNNSFCTCIAVKKPKFKANTRACPEVCRKLHILSPAAACKTRPSKRPALFCALLQGPPS